MHFFPMVHGAASCIINQRHIGVFLQVKDTHQQIILRSIREFSSNTTRFVRQFALRDDLRRAGTQTIFKEAIDTHDFDKIEDIFSVVDRSSESGAQRDFIDELLFDFHVYAATACAKVRSWSLRIRSASLLETHAYCRG